VGVHVRMTRDLQDRPPRPHAPRLGSRGRVTVGDDLRPHDARAASPALACPAPCRLWQWPAIEQPRRRRCAVVAGLASAASNGRTRRRPERLSGSLAHFTRQVDAVASST
jgi:hypothetical protein